MEHINKIELQGYVGSVSKHTVGNRQIARFTVATQYVYKDLSGMVVVDVTWHSISATENCDIDMSLIEKGNPVHITGRIRNTRYTRADGSEANTVEVIAASLEIVKE